MTQRLEQHEASHRNSLHMAIDKCKWSLKGQTVSWLGACVWKSQTVFGTSALLSWQGLWSRLLFVNSASINNIRKITIVAMSVNSLSLWVSYTCAYTHMQSVLVKLSSAQSASKPLAYSTKTKQSSWMIKIVFVNKFTCRECDHIHFKGVTWLNESLGLFNHLVTPSPMYENLMKKVLIMFSDFKPFSATWL